MLIRFISASTAARRPAVRLCAKLPAARLCADVSVPFVERIGGRWTLIGWCRFGATTPLYIAAEFVLETYKHTITPLTSLQFNVGSKYIGWGLHGAAK